MVVSATFNIGDLRPYVEDALEDPSNLRSNPPEEGRLMQKHVPWSPRMLIMPKRTLANQIQALFSFPSS